MKKKILYLIILGFIAISPNYVDAAKTTGKCSAVLQMNKIYDNGTRYFNMSLNGAQAFCIDPGYAASSGNICHYDSAQTATTNQLRIINYANGSNIVSQNLSYTEQQEAYINLSRGESLSGILSDYSNAIGLEAAIVSEFTSTQPAQLGSDAIIMTCGANQQRMIVSNADIGCIEEEKALACPNGQMNVNNSGTSCREVLGGVVSSYSYTASSGSMPNVHQQYGQDVNASGTGAYCKMFCQEYGEATLPGALATAVQLGSYIVWPTSETNETNKFTKDMYPLKFKGMKQCKLSLMPDHGNFPGTGCNEDPVAEYVCLYNGSSVAGSKYKCGRSGNDTLIVLGNKGDYSGVRYEQVRIANGNYFNEPSYCGQPKYSIGEEACRKGAFTKYKVPSSSDYYNSGFRYSYYQNLVDDINVKAKAASEACSKFTEKVEADAAMETMCPHVTVGYVTWELCDWIKAARAIRSEYESARGAYHDAVRKTGDIEQSIGYCKTYIANFNWARNILNEIGLCGNFSVGNPSDYFHFGSSANYSFKNGEYGTGGSLQQENNTTYSCSGQCGGLGFKLKQDYLTLPIMDTPGILAGKVSQIENREITLETNTVTYKSTSNYSYVNKKTNKYSTSKLNSNFLEILTRNNSLAKVLPTDYNVSVIDSSNNAIKYDLTLTNVSFGENLKFKVNNGSDYICKYEVTKKNDGCVCPQDTEMAGKDLMYHVANDPISCADAQVKYCSSGEEKPFDELYCPDVDKPISLTSCLKTGIGYDKCVQLVCTDEYKCKNTNGLRTGMDITDCVQTKRAQGLTLDQALDYCDSVVCPIGKFIIYRTIRLENPFPGKEISKIAPGFNNDVIGRYPGANWNGKELVEKKIRRNRSISGTTIYNKKDPLYTFVLTGPTIEKIRDYNKKQKDGYNDFTLECKKKNSSGCISYVFVHNSNLSGLTGGTCQNISLDNGFYTCDD